MTVPTYDQFIEPLLRYLAANENGVTAKQAHEQVANALGLSEEDKQTMLPSGAQLIYKNRAGWAHDRLKRARLSSSPRRGFWKITAEGMEFIRTRPDPFAPQLSEQLAMGYLGVKLQPSAPDGNEANQKPFHLSPQVGPLASPDDRLGQAISELREAAETELLELLANVSPAYFETIVLDLLHLMGYGASRADLQRVGGTGDGGIDGVISLDRLGLEKVYIQAKL